MSKNETTETSELRCANNDVSMMLDIAIAHAAEDGLTVKMVDEAGDYDCFAYDGRGNVAIERFPDFHLPHHDVKNVCHEHAHWLVGNNMDVADKVNYDLKDGDDWSRMVEDAVFLVEIHTYANLFGRDAAYAAYIGHDGTRHDELEAALAFVVVNDDNIVQESIVSAGL